MAREEWHPFQEFMIRERGEGPVQDVEFRGAAHARPTEQVLDAVARAEAVVIGPSNPIVSIGPMLALPGLRAALAGTSAPVVAVSPMVKGQVLKGPTAAFMQWAGLPLSSDGIAGCYAGLIDGLVADQRTAGVPVLETGMLMADAASRRRLAEETIDFARGLA
jgi:LPPG:FO 2-phospho-L-lactate transferase